LARIAGLALGVATAARSENPFAYWRSSPREVAHILARADRAASETLWKALGEALTEDG
jgi:hypothetical protein